MLLFALDFNLKNNMLSPMPQLSTILENILIKYSQKNLDLTSEKLMILSIKENWHQVTLEMLSNIFEQLFTKKERHTYGIYYTSKHDIMQIVKPTISNYWLDKINRANSAIELQNLHEELVNYKVLDPACGSGNFLYVAYQELKYIEKMLLDKLDPPNPPYQGGQNPPNPPYQGGQNPSTPLIKGGLRGDQKVSPQQFYGMDINSFAVELAKVTLMIGRKVAIDNLGLNEPSLPLDQLDSNIICQDALFTNWINADAIIGNPPFLGSRNIRLTLGDEYSDRLFAKYPKNVDFCSYWFKLAHDNINDNGRVGLVATNSISQNQSRAVSLDYILANNGYIYHAISTQEWSGDAAVYVSIVNWCKTQPKHYILDGKEVTNINSSLTTIIDVTKAQTLKVNLNQCFQGIIPNGKDFYITEEKFQEWINKDEKNKDVLKLSISADDLATNPHGKPSRWIIDFNDMSLEDASNYQLPFEHIKINVKPERDKNKDKKTREYWWLFPRNRPAMRDKIKDLSCYFIIPRVSK
ncbi:MAG TPA: DNA methyltransferase, partial [Allocoleopsis sp.]